MAVNPYNSTRPGHLFVGYDNLRQRIIRSLQNGKSFAIVGGRRCGKTSLLRQLEKDIVAVNSSHHRLISRRVDIQVQIPHSTEEFFYFLSRHIVEDTDIELWQPTHARYPYFEFLSYLRKVAPQLTTIHGPNWVIVFLIDELEIAAKYLPNDECFHNLKHFL